MDGDHSHMSHALGDHHHRPKFLACGIVEFSSVYGPVLEELKLVFLDELREVRAEATGPLLICGDFNQIYCAADKNNDRLNLRSMRRFSPAARQLAATGALPTWKTIHLVQRKT